MFFIERDDVCAGESLVGDFAREDEHESVANERLTIREESDVILFVADAAELLSPSDGAIVGVEAEDAAPS